jgi:uncharacterized protein YbaR (Trm112 family)
MAISRELLEILVCPRCKGPIELTADESWLLCSACRLRYPVREDIPVMLVDEAEKICEE